MKCRKGAGMANRRGKVVEAYLQPIKPGNVYLMPLADGRLGVCRVIKREAAPRGRAQLGSILVVASPWIGLDSFLVVASPWIGRAPPELTEPRLRDILILTHHSWDNHPEALWTIDPLPGSFKLLGVVEPSPNEELMQCPSFGEWSTLALQVLLQWRWDNDREALLEEDAEEEKRRTVERATEARRRREYLEDLTLEALRRKKWLKTWTSFPPAKATSACRKNFRDTVDALIRLGPEAKREEVLAILQACIERFNSLDATMGHFIETVEREILCEEFEEIAHAAGLGESEDLADKWREW